MIISRRISSLVLISLAAGLLATGCGGGDDSLTKAEFVKQADAICQKMEEKKGRALENFLLKLDLPYGKTMSQADQEVQVKEVAMPLIRTSVEEIDELGAPEGEEEKVDAIVESMEKAINRAESESEEKIDPGPRGYPDPFIPAAKLSREFGFKTCYVNY